MAEKNKKKGSRSNAGERVAGSMEFFKKRLQQDARRMSKSDIDELEQGVPEKLGDERLRGLQENLGWIAEMIDRVKLLFRMIRDREYTIDFRIKALVAAALAYFVLPTDVIPDFIPGLGYVDDALVLTVLWNMIHEEIERYGLFRRETGVRTSAIRSSVPGELGSINDLP
jgi:uncharacterized membrane protein YkvA (DUF1232 family)